MNNMEAKGEQRWGTWEELVLACAVKRHGFKNWDSVASELQSKTSLPQLLTSPHFCHQKYLDLHRRFTTTTTTTTATTNIDNPNNDIPWLDHLRQLRVAELKQDLLRYDTSIHSLQLKVKRLEEEREISLQRHQNDLVRGPILPDLHHDASQNHVSPSNKDDSLSAAGDDSDRENRSVNESNSTGTEDNNKDNVIKLDDEPLRASQEAQPVLSGSNSKPVSEAEELGCDSATQLSSEVQSSASLGRKRSKGRKRRREEAVGGGSDGVQGPTTAKSEPFLAMIETIRSHKLGSLFEGRLQAQETDLYKNMIRQHLDLETIRGRLEQGSYSSSSLAFYRDLLLLFNNAIVFFSKSSNESLAAYELRLHVLNEMKKETQKSDFTVAPEDIPPQPKSELERSDSLLAKNKASAPIVVCRKRSSLSAKPSPSSFAQKIEQQQQQEQQNNENEPASDLKTLVVDQSSLKIEPKEKPVTGTRSSRRSNKNLIKEASSPPNKKRSVSPATKGGTADKPEKPKTDKKKTEALAQDKKRSAADFLKRIKKNSPVETSKKNTRGNVNGGGERKKDSIGKGEKGKERVLRRHVDEKQAEEDSSPLKINVGRPSKKAVELSKFSGKRGREGGGKETVKRPKKRSRR